MTAVFLCLHGILCHVAVISEGLGQKTGRGVFGVNVLHFGFTSKVDGFRGLTDLVGSATLDNFITV